MIPYPMSFYDLLRKRDMKAVGAEPPVGGNFSLLMPDANQDLMVKSGLGGGMRDSNIQDATGLTGGGSPVTGGSGGGMRDSNITDTTGTTGGNAAAAETKDKPFDWDGLSSGFAMLGKGMKGMGGNQGDIRAPALSDDSAQRMAAASQLWQSVMNKRKPKGLI